MTNHLDEGTIQAFLDDELASAERAHAAEHLLACDRCGTVKEELVRAQTTFSEQVALLDVAPPSAGRPPTGSRRWLGAGSLVKAASLTLLVAAAASAAVPGSPVRAWIIRTVGPTPAVETASETAASEPTPAPEPPPVAGVAVVPTGPVEIVLSGVAADAIRLVETEGRDVAVSVAGGAVDPTFHTAPGAIEVRGGEGGQITVGLPRSVATARLVVDGRLYAQKVDGELEVHVSAETVEGVRVWR